MSRENNSFVKLKRVRAAGQHEPIERKCSYCGRTLSLYRSMCNGCLREQEKDEARDRDLWEMMSYESRSQEEYEKQHGGGDVQYAGMDNDDLLESGVISMREIWHW